MKQPLESKQEFITVMATDHAPLRRAFDVCVRKTRSNIKCLADEPKSGAWALDGNYFKFQEGFYEIGNWTSSFFTGMALLAWRETEEEYFLQQTLRLAAAYREKACVRFLDMHHNAGFLYSLYSVALYKCLSEISKTANVHARRQSMRRVMAR
jgi:unsaturated chondroitin disaccharide hydrolase